MGRVKYAAKNIAMGYVSSLVTAILNFILRTIFIYKLGDTLNGVNGLYTEVLSMLSLAELGIGTAMNYSLYGPVARGEVEKVKSYMALYRKSYRIIALVIAGIGLALAPFLPYIIKDPGTLTVRELTIYYLIFLFNTVSTYFVSYKYSLANAEQKNYIQTNINMVSKVITILLQIVVLLVFENFLLYLLTAAMVELAQKIFAAFYLNKRYPYLKDKEVEKLEQAEVDEVVKKTKALMLHKIGDTARLQTDSLIITSFINVTTTGFVTNYNIVISTVSNFVNIIFNSVISSFGNLVATESKEKQYHIFRVYRFFAIWIYGFFAIGFFTLLTPLVQLWVGPRRILPGVVINCILIDYFLKGERIVLSNFKTAAGVFEQDKYLAMIQGVVNLIISIVLVREIGLVGVYIGTIVSGLIANLTKPVIIYKACFDRSAKAYYMDSLKYLPVIGVITAICYPIHQFVMAGVSIGRFLAAGILVTIVFHVVFLLCFYRTREMQYILEVFRRKLKRSSTNSID